MKRHVPYYKQDALSGQERSALIESCPNTQYLMLKAKAEKAKRQRKIFIISGGNAQDSLLRKLLVDRGWVEKIPAHRINVTDVAMKPQDNKEDLKNNSCLERLIMSILVESAKPNFIWYCKDGYHDTAPNTLINRFRNEAMWATKEGLCRSLNNIPWYHIDDVAEVTYPRTHISSNEEGRRKFEEDYKITACSSLLKWLLFMVTNERPIFTSSGKISHNIIRFAFARSIEYLLVKQNKDIDTEHCFNTTINDKWNHFLKIYYALVTDEVTFKPDTDRKVLEYLAYAEYLLEQMYKYRPQLSCDGYLNIWIIKPSQSAQGRGITMESKFSVLCASSNKGVFQKYIEVPLLIHDTKFDIRQYYLVINTIPLEIWLYKDCYLKFSSQKYSVKNFHASVHLTNHAVQKNYTNCDERHPELPQTNMWSLETFKEYLRKQGQEHMWDKVIYPGMRRNIIATMLCSQESMITFDDHQKRFQIYGCDFVLDKDHTPWLIEINSKPDLNSTTPVTADICPAAITDMVKVVFDRAVDENAPTGKFECIFRQNIRLSHIALEDLTVFGRALPINYFYKGPHQVDDSVYGMEEDILPLLQTLSNSSISTTSSLSTLLN